MELNEIRIAGYRSIRDLRIELGRVNVIVGPNGAGKTNLYRSIYLLQAAAAGTLARTLVEEGGMPSVLWAGERRDKKPVRLTLGMRAGEFEFELSLGLPAPGRSSFSLDPEIKEERLWFHHKRTRVALVERDNSLIKARDGDGNRHTFPLAAGTTESALAELRDPERFSVIATIRQEFLSWRFYHQFRTDADSPIRQPQAGTRTPILSPDGRDLAAALQTIREIGDATGLQKAVDEAFAGSSLGIATGKRFSILLTTPSFPRAFEVNELSDGTLKYLCLVAAMLTPRPPTLMAFNEPEASLHPELMEPLARLIAQAASDSQLWITTHSERLAAAVEKLTGAKSIRLEKVDGETVLRR